MSSPIRHVVHTDGRVGIEDGSGDFVEIAPSLPVLIESHALADSAMARDRLDAGRRRECPAAGPD